MKILNRSVAVVRPKPAFFRWLQSLGEPLLLEPEETEQHGTVYLFPPFVDEEDETLLLERYLPEIFRRELAPFLPDPHDPRWPDPDLSTFRRWFEVRFYPVALDLDPAPLERQKYDPFHGPLLAAADARTEGEGEGEEVDRVLERVYDWGVAFSRSRRFRELPEEQRELSESIVMTFADFMYSYFGSLPEEWEVEGVKRCCLELFPRKVTAEREYFEAVAPVLSAFFAFLGEEGHLPGGAKLAQAVGALGPRVVARAEDPRTWGLAKSFAMAAWEAGFDPADEEDLQAFADWVTQEIASGEREGRERGPKVGRNDPCPCGSGKKYKHCCGRR